MDIRQLKAAKTDSDKTMSGIKVELSEDSQWSFSSYFFPGSSLKIWNSEGGLALKACFSQRQSCAQGGDNCFIHLTNLMTYVYINIISALITAQL